MTRAGHLRRLVVLLAGILVALATLFLPAGTASASSLPAAETRVGAIHPTVTVSVGVAEHIAAGQRRSRAPSLLRPVSGHCVAAEGNDRADRGDGRDAFGRFTGAGGYGASGESRGLADYTTRTGRSVISDQVRATLGDAARYYDGLALLTDGTYEGVEVKSGSAGLTATQRAFDGLIDLGKTAAAKLNGVPITISSTRLIKVPC